MKEILRKIFTKDSGISSRRILAYIFSLVLIIITLGNYDIEYVWALISLIAGLMSLTTISSYYNK